MRFILGILGLFIFIPLNGQISVSTISLGNNITLTSSIEKFDSSKHIFDTCGSDNQQRIVCLIDGRIWFGGDGLALPKTQLRRLTVTINGNAIALDVTSMYNPTFGKNLRKGQFKIEKYNYGYLLYGFFSDGEGSYTAHWKIVKNRSIRMKITNDDSDFSWRTSK